MGSLDRRLPVRLRMRWLWLTVPCVVLPVLATGCAQPAEEPKPDRAVSSKHEEGVVHIPDASRQFIAVEEVSAAKTNSAISAPARVDFRDGAVSQVGAPLEGRVVNVHVRVGQAVKAGDPLVTLASPEAAAMRAALETAKASLREATTELDRQQRMLQQGVGIERDRVAAETKMSSANAELTKVEAGAAFVGTGTGTSLVVRAPIDGVVIGRKATVGLAVQQGGEPLVEIGDPSALWIVADVFERDLSRIHEGLKTRIDLDSARGPLEGRVTSVGTVVTPGLRTAPVHISVDARGAILRPGMYGRVRIAAADAGLTLPTEAVLIKDGKESVVYVQKDPLTFVRRRVVVAQPVEGRVQVVSGIAPGEKVVIRGALLLDGSADQLL